MRALQAQYPRQARGSFLKRVLKFTGLKMILSRPVFGLINRLFKARGKDYEDSVSNSVRGVAKLGKNKQLRYQPSNAMLAMLDRRLRRWRDGSLQPRTRTGQELHELLGDHVLQPATANPIHTYWVFPILVNEPLKMIRRLRDEGFDGANLPRSQAVAAPEDRPDLTPETARDALARLMILPCYPGIPRAELEREASLVNAVLAEEAAESPTG
jgi:dTDP-4-amino-4,6-dideoxygalactose transaminase